MRTIRRDAIQPAQRRPRAWRDCRAPVPSVFPSAASPDGKTEVMFKPRSGESVQTGRLGTPAVPGQTRSARAQARSPRALETIGIHLNIVLGLSNEVGPPHWRSLSNRPWPTSSGKSIRWRRALAKSARPGWGARKTTSGRRCPLPVVGTPRRAAGGDAPYRQLSITSSAIRPSVDSSSVKSPLFWLVKTAITVGPPS